MTRYLFYVIPEVGALSKAELLQLNHTQFSSLWIFVSKKAGNWKNWDHSYHISFKVHIFWEAHKILRNLHLTFVLFKGQIISKWFLVSLISYNKWTKEFNFTTMIPQVDLFLFVFWRKSKSPKNHFEIIWPLVPVKSKVEILQNFVAFSEYMNLKSSILLVGLSFFDIQLFYY